MPGFRHHYAPRPVDTAELSLRGAGVHEKMGAGTVNRPHGIDCFLGVLFHQPGFSYRRPEPLPCPVGSFILWPPNTPHEFGHHHRPWDHSWLLVGGRFIAEAVRASALPCAQPLPLHDRGEFLRSLARIDREALRPEGPDFAYLRNLLHNLLIDLGRELHPPARPRPPDNYLACKTYLEEHLDQRLTLAELAARAHVSVPRFAHGFREFFGLPPIEYLIRLRLQRADFLLCDHNLSVGQVARAVGMPNAHYFSRLYHRRFGHPPSFRRRPSAKNG